MIGYKEMEHGLLEYIPGVSEEAFENLGLSNIRLGENFPEDDTGYNAVGNVVFDAIVQYGYTFTDSNGITHKPEDATFWVKNNCLCVKISVYCSGENITYNETTVYAYDLSHIPNITKVTEIESTAHALQSTISTWYQALRTIALVGLLSVLVYVGIRIILSSSSAQDKAKYKNMLKDWLVAICILFMLHYIMAFMLSVTQNLNEIIQNNVAGTTLDGNTSDKLMSLVRDKANEASEFGGEIKEAFGYTVMYLALVILTFVFTFQYLKRVVFMAFLTMVAPMIALTYPLDKIKDGKAQAFSFWLREYIFNCLIQPVHLLLYTVLISSAFSFATENILYAIVALAFLVPAEKFIKEMFGMKSESPTSQLGAAAGGAMVMSMLNKIKGKPPKEGAEGAGSGASGSSNGVRTATRNGGGAGASGSGSSSGDGSGSNTGGLGAAGAETDTGNSGSTGGGTGSGSSGGIGRGLGNAGKGLAIKGVDGIKSAGIGLLKKAPGAVLGATVGLAATVASGGKDAAALIGGGVAAGSALTSNALGNLGKLGKDTYKDYQQGKFGVEAYSNRQFDKQFYKSDGYKMIAQDESIQKICEAQGINVKEATQQFLDNGITDASKIREALQNGITGDTYKAYEKAEGISIKDIPTLANAGIGASEYNMLKGAGVKDASTMADIVRKHGKDAKVVARNATIASKAKELGITGKNQFIQYVENYGGLSKKDAGDLYDQMKDFWS